MLCSGGCFIVMEVSSNTILSHAETVTIIGYWLNENGGDR